MLCTFFSMVGLVLGFIQHELNTKVVENPLNINRYPDAMDDPRTQGVAQTTRMITMTTTFFAMFCLYKRHEYKKLWINEYFNNDLGTLLYY